MSVSLSLSAREISASRPSFEGKLILQSNLEKMMVNVSYDLVQRVVEELSELYNFDSTEAFELLNLDGITLEKRSLEKRVDKKSEKRVEKAKKGAFQLPFHVKEENCCGLKFAQGLFVQCHMRKVESSSYCQGCSSEASKNASGKPVNGTVEDRLSCDLMAYKSPLGKQVVPYAKWMLKHNLTRSQVTEEASRLGLEIDERHFEMPLSSEAKKGRPKSEKVAEESSSEKKKGRPKKSKKVLEIETNDIFAELVAAASSSECESEEESESELECETLSVSASVVSKASKKSELSEMKKADKESKESEKMAKKEAEKAAKEAEKAAKESEKKKKEEEKAAKEAEKEAKKEAEKASKEAKEAEKKKKEEEKAAKEAEKKKKEEEKVAKEAEKKKKNEKASKENKKEEVEVVEEPIKVVIINAKGQTKKTGLQEGDKKFLRSSKGEILDFKTQDTIGKWNAAESRIEFNEDYVESDDEDEEEEEEYDE